MKSINLMGAATPGPFVQCRGHRTNVKWDILISGAEWHLYQSKHIHQIYKNAAVIATTKYVDNVCGWLQVIRNTQVHEATDYKTISVSITPMSCWLGGLKHLAFEFINYFVNDYPSFYIHSQHDCLSPIDSNLMISVKKNLLWLVTLLLLVIK